MKLLFFAANSPMFSELATHMYAPAHAYIHTHKMQMVFLR